MERSSSFSGMTRALRRLGSLKHKPCSTAAALTDGAAAEAAALADFCADARARHMGGGKPAGDTLCVVLAAFRFAFQEESVELMAAAGRRARRE